MKKYRAISQNVLDCPSSMSLYEKESLAAEAKLRAKKRKTPAGEVRKVPRIIRKTLTEKEPATLR